MKGKFTYKELTVLIGIVVALIIMITLWLKPFSVGPDEVSVKPMKQIVTPAAKIALKKLIVVAFGLVN